jgi:predicted transcriptional regulator
VVVEARYLTSADVSRRLGVEGGTVRHYAEILRELGFPMGQDPETGAYLWSPELVEVARAAYSMAKATRGLSFKEAVELILYAGEAAQHAKSGRSILTLLHQALSLPARLEEAVGDVRDAVDDLSSVGEELRRELQGVVRDYRGELARSVVEVREVAMKAREVVREASSGGWVAPVAMVLVAIGLALPTFATGGLAAVGPYLVVLAVGGFLGWWARG